jgi:Cu/Ag efflux protein CusF
MKRLIATAAAVALAVGLAACSKKEEPAAAAASGDMADMKAPAAGAKMAKGTGAVTAVDAAAGTITLDHGPIPEANWPAMTMTFKAGPSVTSAVKPGDKVSFDLKLEGGAGEITAVRKQEP